ncbi:MAG: sugar phosphate isomerase/epimerase family protein [Nibricoccus sp.]
MSQTETPDLPQISRRSFLSATAVAGAVLLQKGLFGGETTASGTSAHASHRTTKQRYKIAAADIMLLKRQKLGALPLAKELGLDGVEVDMGGLGDRPTFDNKLLEPTVRQQYLDKLAELDLEICSLAMTGFFSQSLAEREGFEATVQTCIDSMVSLRVKTAFLPLGIKGDLKTRPELRPAVVSRLKRIGSAAEKAGVVIGVETSLSATEEVKLFEEIGAPAIRSYFNFANAIKNGRDIREELRVLGRERVCQIHCTNEDGVWLQNDSKVDLPRIKQTLDEIGWSGWLVMERSRDAADPKNVKRNFGANAAYLRSILQS